MRRLEVAAVALLVAGAAAAALVLLHAVCRGLRHRSISKRPAAAAPELPLSTTPRPRAAAATTKGWRHHHDHLALALLLLLCSGRRRRLRARVEPAAAPPGPGSRTTTTADPAANGHAPTSSSASTAALQEEEVTAWRERWFGGPVSRALYTIYEERDEEDEGDEEAAGSGGRDGDGQETETETPFYTPPASPPQRAASDNGSLESRRWRRSSWQERLTVMCGIGRPHRLSGADARSQNGRFQASLILSCVKSASKDLL